MPTIDGASLNGLLSTPLALGAVAALLAVLLLLAILRVGVARRLLVPVAVAGRRQLRRDGHPRSHGRQAIAPTARRALSQRYAELTAQALVPGSALACLDGAAGEAVETACEKTVFAGPQATAAAVAYMAARLTLLADGLAFARHDDPDFAATLAGLRRAIELDRFGIAAHVLAMRDGCTAETLRCLCAAVTTPPRSSPISRRRRLRPICRRATPATGTQPRPQPVPLAQLPARLRRRRARLRQRAPPANRRRPCRTNTISPRPPRSRAVSIMNAEPPLPKGACRKPQARRNTADGAGRGAPSRHASAAASASAEPQGSLAGGALISAARRRVPCSNPS